MPPRVLVLLALATLTFGAVGAHAETPLSISVALQATRGGTDTAPTVVVRWALRCSEPGATYGWGGLQLVYIDSVGSGLSAGIDDDHPRPVSGLSSGELSAQAGVTEPQGESTFTGNLAGTAVVARFAGAYCHKDQRNSPLTNFKSDLVVLPPTVQLLSVLNATTYQPITGPITTGTKVILGVAFGNHFVAAEPEHPHQGENLEVHVGGANVDCSHGVFGSTCLRILWGNNGADDEPMRDVVTPRNAGTLYVWAVYQPFGLRSNMAKISVVDPAGKVVDEPPPTTATKPPRVTADPPSGGANPTPGKAPKPPAKPPAKHR